MTISDILFYLFAGLAVLSAAVVLFSRNILYSAFALVVTFLAVAAIYVLAGAEFVAITQIMIYVGGIVVLLIFGVMLTNKISGKALVTEAHNKFWAVVVCGGLFTLLLYGIFRINFALLSGSGGTTAGTNNVQQLGIGLMSDYILPFEVAAILLLIALIGAATIAGYKNENQ
ncbi:NADH-ubiquinone oxidoreductase chain J [Fulvivirga imtechensis AK7]|uniref:NADH-quinone oxidoreductase subunit J n=1 Tax=Fulvivirga imtechensis AK7 TaxID=1237149 RepID=L8JQM3_9BACT|nr:NADH-quinone oxidoreductase subunit J [Fulvivirga imtechensis]ELR70528.1 NADH-ubiquinone oxidoreductase chain J [Fulvivirga imtechensis AK7]